MNRIGFTLLMTAVVISPIFFGSVHIWAYTMVFSLVLAGAFFVTLSQIDADPVSGKMRFSVPVIGMGVVCPVIALMCILQMTPFPAALIQFSQPGSFQMAVMAQSPGTPAPSFVSLAPYRWPVRQSLVRWIVYAMLYWGLVQTLNTRKRIETAVWLILGIAALESLYGMFEAFAGSHRVLWYGKSAYPGSVSGTYINRNHFAGLMEMTLPLAFCAGAAIRVGRLDPAARIRIKRAWLRKIFPFISGRHGGEKRILILVLSLIIGMGLIGSASRGGILAALAALLVTGLLFLKSTDTRKKGWVMLVTLALLGVLSFRVDVENTLRRFTNLQSSFDVRYRYTRQTLQLARAFPLAGAGLGSFRYAFPHYQSAEDKNYLIDYAHNDWVQFAAEAGWGGALVGTGCMIGLLVEMWILWRRRTRTLAVSLGAAGFGAATAVIVHSWSDFNMHIPANALMLMSLLALAHSALLLERHKDGYRMANRIWAASVVGWGGVALFVVLSMIGYAGIWTLRHAAGESNCGNVGNSTLRQTQKADISDCMDSIGWDRAQAATWYRLGKLFSARATKAGTNIESAVLYSNILKNRYPDLLQLAHSPDVESNTVAEENKENGILRLTAIACWKKALSLDPFDSRSNVQLGWAGILCKNDSPCESRGADASETYIKRAEYLAPMDIDIQQSIGNYWLMRCARIEKTSAEFRFFFNRALQHYRLVLNLLPANARKTARDEMIQTAARRGLSFKYLLKIGQL